MKLNKKNIFLMIMVLIIFSFLYAITIWYQNAKIKSIDVKKMESDNKIEYFIDTIDNKSKFIEISGWVVKPKGGLSDAKILLKNLNGEFYEINTENFKRSDLGNLFDEGDIKNSGFFAKVNKNKLKPNDQFDVYIYLKNNNEDILIDTKQKIRG